MQLWFPGVVLQSQCKKWCVYWSCHKFPTKRPRQLLFLFVSRMGMLYAGDESETYFLDCLLGREQLTHSPSTVVRTAELQERHTNAQTCQLINKSCHCFLSKGCCMLPYMTVYLHHSTYTTRPWQASGPHAHDSAMAGIRSTCTRLGHGRHQEGALSNPTPLGHGRHQEGALSTCTLPYTTRPWQKVLCPHARYPT